MSSFLERHSGRSEYRTASVLLAAVFLFASLSPLFIVLSSGGALLAITIAASSYLILTILTYRRLRDALISGWWLLPMVLNVHIGPTWSLGSWAWGSVNFSLSGFIAFVPVIMGWFAGAADAKQAFPDTRSA